MNDKDAKLLMEAYYSIKTEDSIQAPRKQIQVPEELLQFQKTLEKGTKASTSLDTIGNETNQEQEFEWLGAQWRGKSGTFASSAQKIDLLTQAKAQADNNNTETPATSGAEAQGVDSEIANFDETKLQPLDARKAYFIREKDPNKVTELQNKLGAFRSAFESWYRPVQENYVYTYVNILEENEDVAPAQLAPAQQTTPPVEDKPGPVVRPIVNKKIIEPLSEIGLQTQTAQAQKQTVGQIADALGQAGLVTNGMLVDDVVGKIKGKPTLDQIFSGDPQFEEVKQKIIEYFTSGTNEAYEKGAKEFLEELKNKGMLTQEEFPSIFQALEQENQPVQEQDETEQVVNEQPSPVMAAAQQDLSSPEKQARLLELVGQDQDISQQFDRVAGYLWLDGKVEQRHREALHQLIWDNFIATKYLIYVTPKSFKAMTTGQQLTQAAGDVGRALLQAYK